mmetsp:Transcript_2043/g.6048  ORF Transcript_2043/g.6048 Transcript_2043/m.6048 type:complete len:293 (-) Transcript_2043:328-1206(-)
MLRIAVLKVFWKSAEVRGDQLRSMSTTEAPYMATWALPWACCRRSLLAECSLDQPPWSFRPSSLPRGNSGEMDCQARQSSRSPGNFGSFMVLAPARKQWPASWQPSARSSSVNRSPTTTGSRAGVAFGTGGGGRGGFVGSAAGGGDCVATRGGEGEGEALLAWAALLLACSAARHDISAVLPCRLSFRSSVYIAASTSPSSLSNGAEQSRKSTPGVLSAQSRRRLLVTPTTGRVFTPRGCSVAGRRPTRTTRVPQDCSFRAAAADVVAFAMRSATATTAGSSAGFTISLGGK